MRAWVPWRRVTLLTPHPPREVQRRLRALLPPQAGTLVGDVNDAWVTLWLPRNNPRTLAPLARGALRPDGEGGALDLTVRFPASDLLFLGLGLGLAAALFAAAVSSSVRRGELNPGVVVPGGLFTLGLTAASVAFSRGARALLRRLALDLDAVEAPWGASHTPGAPYR